MTTITELEHEHKKIIIRHVLLNVLHAMYMYTVQSVVKLQV